VIAPSIHEPHPLIEAKLACRTRRKNGAIVKAFGRRPSRTFPHAPRLASENLEGTNPQEGARIGSCRALSYGDLTVDGPQLKWRSGRVSAGDGPGAQDARQQTLICGARQ
jgi:hypothetical protein